MTRCADCPYYDSETFTCHHDAPKAHVILMPPAVLGAAPKIMIQSVFPPVPPDGWCGQSEPRTKA